MTANPHSNRSPTPNGSPPNTQSRASIDELYTWLVELFVQVRRPAHCEQLSDETIRVYAEKLTEFHPASVRQVLEDWPDHSDWWPTWQELVQQLPSRGWTPDRALPAPARPGLGKRQYVNLHERMTSAEWAKFQAAMDVLRDDEQPVMGREFLLRMGKAIERRQRSGR